MLSTVEIYSAKTIEFHRRHVTSCHATCEDIETVTFYLVTETMREIQQSITIRVRLANQCV